MATPSKNKILGLLKKPAEIPNNQNKITEELQKQVIEWTKSRYVTCKASRQYFERQWYLNIAFYLGRQNVSLFPLSNSSSASGGTRLYVPPVPYWRSRPVINLIRPAIRNEVAKLTAQKPTATIVPASTDERDMYAAQAGEQLWESVYRDKNLKKIFRQTVMWAVTTGNGFLKIYWDPNKTTKDQPPGTQPLGDFCFDAITPFHLYFPDMLCQDIEDQPYVIHVSTRTMDFCKINYPNLQIRADVSEATDIINDSFLNLVGGSNLRNNAVMCYEVWVKPGQVDIMPNGGMFTILGDNLVQWEPGFSYEHRQYPFTQVGHIPANRFYYDSVITDLMPIQREYNRTRGQIQEAKNRMAQPKISAQEGSIDAAKITTEPGQVVFYKLGYQKPEPLPMQDIPSYVIQEVASLRADFEDISGQHDISKGQTPPGVTAATAISFLQEQDETMLSSTFQSIEEAYEKIGYQTLCLIKQYWDMPRTVRVVGTDGQFNAMVFKGADIGANTDIRIEAGSALPTSKAARQALLMDLMQLQFIPPEKGLELMDMGGVQRLYDNIKIDNAQASRENMKMAAINQDMLSQYLSTFTKQPEPVDPISEIMNSISPVAEGPQDPSLMGGMEQEAPFIDPHTGGPLVDAAGNPTQPPLIVPVNSYDNHQVHIEVHNNYRKSQEFENLPQEVKNLFEEHVNQHMQAMGIIPGLPMPSGSMMDSGSMQSGQQEEIDPSMQQMMDGIPPVAGQEQQGGVQ